ncbi:MAG: hypothetical protein AAF533_15740 [Acidobacteriota bacterium]
MTTSRSSLSLLAALMLFTTVADAWAHGARGRGRGRDRTPGDDRPIPRRALIPALKTAGTLAGVADMDNHHVFDADSPRDIRLAARNTGDGTMVLTLVSDEGRERIELAAGEIQRVLRRGIEDVWAACEGGGRATSCQLTYQIEHAPSFGGPLELVVSNWVPTIGCMSTSDLEMPGSSCTTGSGGGQLCVEVLSSEVEIVPEPMGPRPPIDVFVQRCPNLDCSPVGMAADVAGDLEVTVEFLDAPTQVFVLDCESTTLNATFGGVERVTVRSDCVGTNGCSNTCTTAASFVRYQACADPALWLLSRP